MGAGGGSQVVPAQGSSRRPGGPTGAAAVKGRAGVPPDFPPGCYVFHIPSCRWPDGAEDRATPPSRRGDVHNTASLEPLVPPCDAQTRRGKPWRGELPGGTAALLHHLRRVTARTLPPPAAPAPDGQPERSRLPGESPTAGSPAASQQPGRAATPFPLTCFFPIFFFGSN